MSWLDEAENSKQAYQVALQKFLSVRDRISNMTFNGIDVFSTGVRYKDDTFESSEKGVKFISSHGLIEGRGDIYASIYLNASFASFGCTTPFNQAVRERRIFIGDGTEIGSGSDYKEIISRGDYTINFVTIQSYQQEITSLLSHERITVTKDELTNISEDAWADLFGWVVWKSKNIPFDRLEPYVSDKSLDVFAYIREKAKKNPPKKSSGCYIATACYGSYDAQEVLVFRKYRDDILLKSSLGKGFVAIYYKFSPYFAQKLENMPKVNSFVKRFILDSIYKKLIMKK